MKKSYFKVSGFIILIITTLLLGIWIPILNDSIDNKEKQYNNLSDTREFIMESIRLGEREYTKAINQGNQAELIKIIDPPNYNSELLEQLIPLRGSIAYYYMASKEHIFSQSIADEWRSNFDIDNLISIKNDYAKLAVDHLNEVNKLKIEKAEDIRRSKNSMRIQSSIIIIIQVIGLFLTFLSEKDKGQRKEEIIINSGKVSPSAE